MNSKESYRAGWEACADQNGLILDERGFITGLTDQTPSKAELIGIYMLGRAAKGDAQAELIILRADRAIAEGLMSVD
jgi:hypothetical protein